MASSFQWLGMSPDGATVTLRRFGGEFQHAVYATEGWLKDNPDLVRTGVVLDTETTGLNRTTDKVIEIGLRPFLFNRETGELLQTLEGYNGLQDPGIPLSLSIQRLTGLTPEKLRGRNIDWDHVSRLLSDCHLVIAHNASFDRPFVDSSCPISCEKIWGCTATQIDWLEKGFPSGKLELLSIYHGFYTDAHRALADADALLHLISMSSGRNGRPYLAELIKNARKPFVRITAHHSPFETKDLLRTRGYRWDTSARVWRRILAKERLDDEMAWLEAAIYKGDNRAEAIEVPLVDNFKRS